MYGNSHETSVTSSRTFSTRKLRAIANLAHSVATMPTVYPAHMGVLLAGITTLPAVDREMWVTSVEHPVPILPSVNWFFDWEEGSWGVEAAAMKGTVCSYRLEQACSTASRTFRSGTEDK